MTFPQIRDTGADAGSSPSPRVVLLTRIGCHLCDDARVIVSRVVDELGEHVLERDIDAEPSLAQEFGEQLPVLFVDGVQLDFWRVSESRLRAALALKG